MKKVLLSLLLIVAGLPLMAQSDVNMEIKQFESEIKTNETSTREYYADLPARMTKVVLAGDNSMADLLLKDAIEKGWNISPFEFCDYEEFERIKCDTNYYFLMRINVEAKVEGGTGMEFVTFVKGDEKASEGIDKMPELISLPMFDVNDKSGRVFSYMPAYVNIIQNYIQKIVDGRIYPALRLTIITNPIESATDKTILFAKDDIAYEYTEKDIDRFGGMAKVVSLDDIDDALTDGEQGTLVSLVVAPAEPVNGSSCYKMLISSDTYELYYYRRHRISKSNGVGFIKEDLRRLSTPYRIKK